MSATPPHSPAGPIRPARAPQACRRCRQKKLKCTGGQPCRKCLRASHPCDFDDRPGVLGNERNYTRSNTTVSFGGDEATARIAQLEKTLADLISGLQPTPQAISSIGQVPNTSQLETLAGPPIVSEPSAVNVAGPNQWINPTIHPTPPTIPSLSPVNIFGLSPASQDALVNRQPKVGFVDGISPASSNRRKANPEDPEARLETATTGYAPFQPLTYHPSNWDNREISRPSSPRPEDSVPVFEARAGLNDDPVSLGWIAEDLGNTLVAFFFEHCHPSLPLLRGTTPGTVIRSSSSYLYTVIISIVTRTYARYAQRHSIPSPAFDTGLSNGCAQLAYSHLAASMFRKQHRLEDVQATLLLSGWGLQSSGGGPDPWLVTGHCVRLARRLGLHRTPYDTIPDGQEEKIKLLNKWRVWLCWYHFDGFLSLGYGRPQTTWLDPPNENRFLQLSQSIGPSASDAYIASFVQLTQMARELTFTLHANVDPRPNIEEFKSIQSLLRDLNAKLDQWASIWTWSGSLQCIQLGELGVLAKLQAEHIRLCLNSLTLRPEVETEQQYLHKAADAAINTVQIHTDIAKRGQALSCAVDYFGISLAQAAVFLIRLHVWPHTIPVDRAVLPHYIDTAVVTLQETDLTEIRHTSYLAKVVRDLCRVAGVSLPSDVANDLPLDSLNTDHGFDFQSFLQLEGVDLDLAMIFNGNDTVWGAA